MKLTLCTQNFSIVHMSLLFFFALATQGTPWKLHYDTKSEPPNHAFTSLCLWAYQTWNAQRVFWFWVVINWFHLQKSSFFQISRFGVTKYFSSRLWMVAKIFHLSIKIFGGLARCNAHFIPWICIEVLVTLIHRRGPQ
jgi:hypothetical protein